MPSSPSPKDKISVRIKAGDTAILGLSGGPDSVYLLYYLQQYFPHLQVIAAHVNYHLRGRDSELDQQFVEKLCRELQIPLEILEIHGLKNKNTAAKGNLEENCRRLRYDFLEKLRLQHQANLIMVGHHLNDQLETFLLNLSRGSSLNGFRAMREFDEDRHLLRPLLAMPKKEILAWLKKHHHQFRIDKSNQQELFKRNLIRARVIPTLEKINPSFLITAGNSLQDLTANLQVIDNLTNDWIKQHCQMTKKAGQIGYFDLTTFLAQPQIMQKNILRQLYKNIHGKSLTSPTIIEILKTFQKNRAGLHKEFGPATVIKIIKDDNKAKRAVVIEKKFH